MNNKKKCGTTVAGSMIWKMLERIIYLGCQFVIQIVLARLLMPNDYGVVSIMTVFTTLAQVFVQTGMTTAVIQAKEVHQIEKSSVFWINLGVSAALGLVFFIIAPAVQQFYGFETFTEPFRVLLVILPMGAVASMQIALLSREMLFKRIMLSSIVAVVTGGCVGIAFAYSGAGVWALVIQQVVYNAVNALVLCFFSKWMPSVKVSVKRIKPLISYGWKILASNIVEVIYNDAVSLMIGKKFSADDLAYYNRGKQYPNYVASCIKEPLQSVMLPAFSKMQEDRKTINKMVRTNIRVCEMLSIWTLVLLAVLAIPLVRFMLTDKWLPCVPYLRIACIFYCFLPIVTIEMSAIAAMGESGVVLKLGIWKRMIALGLIAVSVFVFSSVEVVALTWMVTGFINIALNYKSIKNLINYGAKEQLADVIPCAAAGSCLALFCFLLQEIAPINNDAVIIILELAVGTVIYFAILAAIKFEGYRELKGIIKAQLKKGV